MLTGSITSVFSYKIEQRSEFDLCDFKLQQKCFNVRIFIIFNGAHLYLVLVLLKGITIKLPMPIKGDPLMKTNRAAKVE